MLDTDYIAESSGLQFFLGGSYLSNEIQMRIAVFPSVCGSVCDPHTPPPLCLVWPVHHSGPGGSGTHMVSSAAPEHFWISFHTTMHNTHVHKYTLILTAQSTSGFQDGPYECRPFSCRFRPAAGVNDWGAPQLPGSKWGKDAKQRQPLLLRGNPIHPAGADCVCVCVQVNGQRGVGHQKVHEFTRGCHSTPARMCQVWQKKSQRGHSNFHKSVEG